MAENIKTPDKNWGIKFQLEEGFREAFSPVDAFGEILTDLAFASYSVEGNEKILEQLRTIFVLVSKNTKERLDELNGLILETLESGA